MSVRWSSNCGSPLTTLRISLGLASSPFYPLLLYRLQSLLSLRTYAILVNLPHALTVAFLNWERLRIRATSIGPRTLFSLGAIRVHSLQLLLLKAHQLKHFLMATTARWNIHWCQGASISMPCGSCTSLLNRSSYVRTSHMSLKTSFGQRGRVTSMMTLRLCACGPSQLSDHGRYYPRTCLLISAHPHCKGQGQVQDGAGCP